MTKGDSKALLEFADVQTLASLQTYVTELISNGHDPIRATTFIADDNPSAVFSESVPSEYRVSIDARDEFYKVSLTRRLEGKRYEDGYRLVEGDFYLYQNDETDVWTAFAVCGRDFFRLGLRRYLESLPSTISLPYLSTQELRRLFETVDDRVNGNILVKKAVVKSPDEDSKITYTETPYYEIFDEAQAENRYVDKIQFSLRNARESFDGYVSRDGDTRYIEGASPIYFNNLVEGVASLVSDKGELFSGKAREYGSRESRPLVVEFDESAITDTEDNIHLIQTLDGLSKSSLTVYHKNPYMHASVLDYSDGSSADVFITTENNVSIVPGFNASRSALMRICEQITEGFHEGEVVERGGGENMAFEDYFR